MTNAISAVFFTLVNLKYEVYLKLFLSTLSLVLFAFIFYGFSQVIVAFAADITSGPMLSMVIAPTALLDKLGQFAKATMGNNKPKEKGEKNRPDSKGTDANVTNSETGTGSSVTGEGSGSGSSVTSGGGGTGALISRGSGGTGAMVSGGGGGSV
jgi:hypothetical protein